MQIEQMSLVFNLMTLTSENKLQAVSHVETRSLTVVELSRLPLDNDPVLEFLHCLRVMSVHAALEIIPQILHRAEVTTVWRKIKYCDPMVVKPCATRAGRVWRRVILLEVPQSFRPEGVS